MPNKTQGSTMKRYRTSHVARALNVNPRRLQRSRPRLGSWRQGDGRETINVLVRWLQFALLHRLVSSESASPLA